MTTAAPAVGPSDVPALQTATSLVVLLTSTYQSLQALPFGAGPEALPVLRDHIGAALTELRTTRDRLSEATRSGGGRIQQAPDPKYAPVVAQALPTVRGPGDVAGLALTLEDVLAQTAARDTATLSDPAARGLAAEVAAGAAARKARLLVVGALLSVGAADLVASPPDLTRLPAAVGSLGFPDARFPTDKASPPEEGAL